MAAQGDAVTQPALVSTNDQRSWPIARSVKPFRFGDYDAARTGALGRARFFLTLEGEATDEAGRNLWGSACENEVTGVCRHIPVPAQCPRCQHSEFVRFSPFPSEGGPYVFGAKSRCRQCGWVADDRPDEFQPSYTPGESS